jgi:TonB family protein
VPRSSSLRPASLSFLLAVAVGCAPASRIQSETSPSTTLAHPSQHVTRLETRTGDFIDFTLSRGDTTVALRLGDRADAQAAPRASVRFSPAALRRFADDLYGLARSTMPDDSSRFMWGVEIEDASGDLALHVTRVARRSGGAAPRDSFALAARAGAEPLVMPLAPTEFDEVAGLVSSYAEFLSILPKELPGPDGRPYYGFEVDEPVTPSRAGCSPRYPEQQRVMGVTGEVRARFVVGADGRVEPESWLAVESTHPAFAREVHRASSCFRFHPARVGGQAVRTIVSQPFTFDIAQ